MTPFQQELLNKLKDFAPIYLVGGVVRDEFLQFPSKDVDVIINMDFDYLDKVLKSLGFNPLRIGAKHPTITVIKRDERIDFNPFAGDILADALKRDFTINALYKEVATGKILDPLGGIEDIKALRLRTCSSPEECFNDDPLRLLRMIRFACKYNLEIDSDLFDRARDLIDLLKKVSKERISEELSKILLLEEVDKAIMMLESLGYWQEYLPELWRLKGLVQNRHHTLDAWGHTLQVVRNTPPFLILRLAALFHDLGKWETASRECNVWGKCIKKADGFYVAEFEVRGKNKNLEDFHGQFVEINGARLDHYPNVIQVKRIKKKDQAHEGFQWVENGKRHFLGHEKESGKIVRKVLQRYRFSMVLGQNKSGREQDLIWLIDNHMKGNLTFVAELRGEIIESKLQQKARKFAWLQGWNGREYDMPMLKNLLELWRADFYGGKKRTKLEEENFDKIHIAILEEAKYLQEKIHQIDWEALKHFAKRNNIKGKEYGVFKEYLRRVIMLKANNDLLEDSFLEKEYKRFKQQGNNFEII